MKEIPSRMKEKVYLICKNKEKFEVSTMIDVYGKDLRITSFLVDTAYHYHRTMKFLDDIFSALNQSFDKEIKMKKQLRIDGDRLIFFKNDERRVLSITQDDSRMNFMNLNDCIERINVSQKEIWR